MSIHRRVGFRSVGEVLDKHKGFGPGFDALRIALSLSILWYHSFLVLGLDDRLMNDSPAWLYVDGILPMFFALSGFLIAGSAQRLRLKDFLINRGLRIVPALAVEIAISACLIGVVFTDLPILSYLSDYRFAHYFTNILGWIQFYLPGVFLDNPSSGIVNLSLWTVPFEIACYLTMSFIIIFRVAKRPWLIVALAALILLLPVLLTHIAHPNGGGIRLIEVPTGSTIRISDRAFLKRGEGLLPAFLLGIALYYYRYRIPFSPVIAAVLVAIAASLAVVGSQQWYYSYTFQAGFVPVMVYLTVFIGACSIPKIPFFSRGDYSYGIYLYGFPLQQCLVAVFPSMHNWVVHFAASAVLATATATFSWHLIEKPILKQRKKFSFVGRRIAAEERSQGLPGPVVTGRAPEIASPSP